ncbi:MAG TPA: DUF1302 family protein [Methylibium sp.]|nr:DUF1302 family protein [Methylibium sp.]
MTRSNRGYAARARWLGAVLAALGAAAPAHAVRFGSDGSDWDVSLDTTLQYTLGVRAQGRDEAIGNHPFFAEGDYKFDRGDLVTNRIQGIVELQGAYKGNTGFRVSGSAWKDFAYDDKVETNPNPVFGLFPTYAGNRYSGTTKKYHLRGGELLDAFVFHNTRVDDTPVYLKAGRFTQYWGNAFFFGFSNIAYGQHPVDYIKAFSQPGSEVKELFLPRTQLMASADLTPELSVSAQYFLEYRANRYPEGGTYLGPFNILYEGPNLGGFLAGSLGGPVTAGHTNEPDDVNGNFGVKVAWSPKWAGGDLGFYYRQFDDVHPWALGDAYATGGGRVHLEYAEKSKLYGLSYERTFGLLSTGFELSYRTDTALTSAFFNGSVAPYTKGATGNLVNFIANGLLTLGKTPLWDTGNLIAELSYTRLTDVTGNEALFNGVGYGGCPSGNKSDGCATRSALAIAMLFEPQWLQVFPGVDLSAPMSLTYGVRGNPAYAAGGFYAEGATLYSLGIKANIQQKHTLTLQYNGYHYDTGPKTNDGFGPYYAGFGGNGAVALNDKGWFALVFKTSF